MRIRTRRLSIACIDAFLHLQSWVIVSSSGAWDCEMNVGGMWQDETMQDVIFYFVEKFRLLL